MTITGLVLSCLQPSSIRGLAASWITILHCCLFSTVLANCSVESPVHDVILFNQFVLGLPRARAPGVVPCISIFSKQSPCFLMTCPKYASFLSFTEMRRFLSTPAVASTHSLVFLSVQDTRRSCRRHFISNAFMRASSVFFKVQLSHPYNATGLLQKA